MNKPSMFDFIPQPAAPKERKPAPAIKNIPWRITIPQWEAVSALTVSERLKFQNYLDKLVQEDFARRGLRWPD